MKLSVCYYKTTRGDQPVQKYLVNLIEKDRARVFALLEELVSEGSLEMPHGRKFSGHNNLYEILYRHHRVIYCYYEDKVILLHAFQKKTQVTPKKELKIALARQKGLE